MSNAVLTTNFNKPKGQLYVFGVRQQDTPATVREKLAFSPEKLPAALESLRAHLQVSEDVILSTCNRSEWYFYSETTPHLREWLMQYTSISAAELDKYLFECTGKAAISHLYRVACGLDSLILGEPQILGQLKNAYRISKANHGTGSVLERLFQQSFAVAKQVRNHTGIGQNPVSVAYASVRLTQQFFDDHEKRTAIVIGAGETGTLVARYLRDSKIKRLIIANRTLANAQTLAEEVGGFAITLNQLAEHLHEADIIIGAAHSNAPLLSDSVVNDALEKRHGKLQVYIDLSIPRIFEDTIDKLGNAFLYGLDDLEQIIDKNKESRKKAAAEAEEIIDVHSDEFILWLQSKPQQKLIRNIREHADEQRQQLLTEAYRKLAHGEDPAQVLEEFSHRLTNKLIHHPSAMIRAIPPDHKDWLAIIADTYEQERH